MAPLPPLVLGPPALLVEDTKEAHLHLQVSSRKKRRWTSESTGGGVLVGNKDKSVTRKTRYGEGSVLPKGEALQRLSLLEGQRWACSLILHP